MARASGLSFATAQRIWRVFGLQPHRLETFKLSTDPDFVAKVRDIVGPYVIPPEPAIVLCVYEKSQIQALDRSQPMRPGQPARRFTTTTPWRHIAVCRPRHRNGPGHWQMLWTPSCQEFRKSLDAIEAAVPDDLDVRLVMDNYATHKTPLIRNWLAKRPRWHVHLTPTSSSWLNQVERFCSYNSPAKVQLP
ncbi:transposase [Bradyrhizobium sp. ma5]|uniref:transposase n=1 Tax=Bradyrhizobium sp. ma5 TaxID=3344828 RepID=UPI0035D447E6